MNATQPSDALTPTTGNSSVLRPLPLTSPAGGRPSGSSRKTPRYQVVAVVRRPIRAAPSMSLSVGAGTGVSATRPAPEKSRSSMTFGAPVLVAVSPGTPGSMPLSRMAISTRRPSYVGCSERNTSTPVLLSGMSPSMYAIAGSTAGCGSAARLPSDGAAATDAAGFGWAGFVMPLLEAQAVRANNRMAASVRITRDPGVQRPRDAGR